VRSKEEYDKIHIPAAINIALDDLKNHISQLNKDIQYVTSCDKGGSRSAEAAQLLRASGLKAIWLCGGTNQWFK